MDKGEPLCPSVCSPHSFDTGVSSLLLLPSTSLEMSHVVVGNLVGEISFLPCEDNRRQNGNSSNCLKTAALSNSPITALAAGSLTTNYIYPNTEIVAISADGLVQCLTLSPQTYTVSCVFSQLIQANITAAHIMDVDRDGKQELVVALTDRVVRTFRWNSEERRLQPINKWEVPNQIAALSVGDSKLNLHCTETWVSQLNARYYVCLPLSGKEEVAINYPEREEYTIMMMPYRSYYIYVMGTLISNIVIIANMKERLLTNPGWDICAASTVRLPSFHVVVTVDLRGLLLIYAYNERNIKDYNISPMYHIKTMPNSTHLVVSATGDKQHLLISVADIIGRVLVYNIPISNIKNQLF